jgi:hypothetical protein
LEVLKVAFKIAIREAKVLNISIYSLRKELNYEKVVSVEYST